MSRNLPHTINHGTSILNIITGKEGRFIKFSCTRDKSRLIDAMWDGDAQPSIKSETDIILKKNPLSVHPSIICLAIPPLLMSWLGYIDGKRYIGLFWDSENCYPLAFDGSGRFVVLSTQVWKTFFEHPKSAPRLKTFDFGSDLGIAKHMLIIDTDTLKSHAVPLFDGISLLHATQGPKFSIQNENGEIDQGKLFKLADDLLYTDDTTDVLTTDDLTNPDKSAQVIRAMEIEEQNAISLREWLDSFR